MSDKKSPTAVPSSQIIDEKYKAICPERGEIRVIEYKTRDYVPEIETSGNEITKTARVYLPWGFSESKTYNVVFVLHGMGGDDFYDWLSEDSPNPASIIDNLIFYGDIAPLIAVFPNGRSTATFNNRSDSPGYWYFGQELNNDLIPYMERNFPIGTARENRALCGLSMGGFQTAQIGIVENFPLFRYYGVFSGNLHHWNPYVYMTPELVATRINESELPLGYLFFCCGTQDSVYTNLVPELETFDAVVSPQKVKKGENYSVVIIPDGKHNYAVWQVALYDFLQLIFKNKPGETAE